ncbi:MAG: stage II sporulation protein M [Myxococcota bacterium]
MIADRDAFVGPRRERWESLQRLADRDRLDADEWSRLARGYRSVCADLAKARSLDLPDDVQGYLDDLAGRAHNRLYAVRPVGFGRSLWTETVSGFPRALRAEWRFFGLASALFYVPFLVGFVGALLDTSFAASVLPEGSLQQLESMYSTEDLHRGSAGADASMAGFYVFNNVGIAFRTFAMGVLAGLGSLFFLVYNGLVIGTSAGYLGSVGMGFNLLEFVSGHSAWELTGVCVAGAAGLRLGWAVVVTDGRTLAASLSRAAPALYRLVLGVTLMLCVAAAIEGFWSASPVPRPVKYGFGLVQWVIVIGWFVYGGRRMGPAGGGTAG